MDDGDACGPIEDIVHIADAKAEGDEHAQSQETVEDRGPYHRRGKHTGGILEFLRHVGAGIGAEEAPERCGDANQTGEALISPVSSVNKGGEDLLGGAVVAHDPQYDDEGEVAEDMHDQENALGGGEGAGEENVEADGDEEEEHD